jgi:zinc protease
MDAVMAEFIETGVDEAQLERIKMQLRASQIYERDNVSSLANRYGRALTAGLEIADIQAWPDVLQAVTGDDIIAAAKQVFDKRRSVTGWLMGEEEITQ